MFLRLSTSSLTLQTLKFINAFLAAVSFADSKALRTYIHGHLPRCRNSRPVVRGGSGGSLEPPVEGECMLRMRTSKGTRYTEEHTRSMAGQKRSSDGPAAAAKITKYFCSEVSTGSGVSEGGSQTESDVSLESEFSGKRGSARLHGAC